MTAEEKIEACAQEFERLPGVTVVHEIEGFKPLYMSSNGLDLLGLRLIELTGLGEKYQELFFNRNFIGDYLGQLKEMISRNTITETYTFFHEVKIKGEFQWYASSIQVFHVDNRQHPTHTITYAVPLEAYQWTVKKAQRLLEETEFARKSIKEFSLLSRREKEVLALAAKGNRTADIAYSLSVTKETVRSHLKSIKRKLGSGSSYELRKYALAFDLL